MKPKPGAYPVVHGDIARAIKERDWLTRFSYARGPLCRWPGATVDQVEDRVRIELARLAQRVW